MKKFSEIAKQIEENKKTMEILPTGLPMLDHDLEGGFLKKELVVIGGKTGGGKSLIGGHIFYNVAKQGFKSAYFSLEISNEMLGSRFIGAKANISPTRVMIKQLEGADLDKRNEAKAKVAVWEEFMFFYDDIYRLDLIEKEIRDNKYDFVVIDFLQNIITGKSDEYERLSNVALLLQKLAKETNTCILALSQLSNEVNRSKKTDIIEYKGSGSIATAADLGFFIEPGRAGESSLSLRLRKNRRGISGISYSFMVTQPGGSIVSL